MPLRCLLLTCLLLVARPGQAQLVVDDTMPPAQLVHDVLMGIGVSASNVTFNGMADQGVARLGSGSFVGSGDLGLAAGVILSTGLATSAAGPEDVFNSDALGNNGNDPDLQILVGGNITDHSILEFDLVPSGDTLRFRYVFASKEYPDWVCSEFNDAFGFFLSGPGIAGPFSRGAVNIALLPDRVTPVAINTVHAGGGILCPPTNAIYYVDNIGGQMISHGGYTTVLTASAPVRCGETYHIKLAIADAGGVDDEDTDFDSTVFIEAGSFTSTSFAPRLVPGLGIMGDTILESCFPMGLSFLRSGDLAIADTFLVSYSGSFTNGEDIVPPLPGEVIFPPGEATGRFTFNAPVDDDGPETVVVTITNFQECVGDTVENVFTFVMEEVPPLQVFSPGFAVECGEVVEIAPLVSGGYGAYVFDWGDLGIGPSITVSPLADRVYDVTVRDTCGLSAGVAVPVAVTPVPNSFSVVLASSIRVTGNSVQESCLEELFVFTRTGSSAAADTLFLEVGGQALPGEDVSGLPESVVFAPGVAEVRVSVRFPLDADDTESLLLRLGDVSSCDTLFVERAFSIDPPPVVVAVGGTTVVPCGSMVTLSASATGGHAPYTYTWPDGTVSPVHTVAPTIPTVYEVVVTDTCGTTTRAILHVDLLPPSPLEMQLLDSGTVTEACGSAQVRIIRPEGVDGDVRLALFISGEADAADLVLPGEVIIPSGESGLILSLGPLEDNVADDGEIAIINGSFTDGCGRTVSASVTLEIRDAPPILLTTEDHTVPCATDSIPLVVVATGGVGGLALVWSTGATGPLAYAGTMADGHYTVTASDDCGRTISASSTVTVECEVIVPNVFTPNGDGRNDLFEIEGIMNTRNSLRILNRWGQVVFAAVDYRNDWIGFGLADGTYFYEVVVDGHDKPYTGYVTILRD